MKSPEEQKRSDDLREDINELTSAGSSVKDVVSNRDDEEQEPVPDRAKPIISVHGEDVERMLEEEQNLPEDEHPAA